MLNLQQQSFCQNQADCQVLSRGAYSPTPLYFVEQPVNTATGKHWLTSHSLREIGAQVGYQPSPEGIRDFLCYGFAPAPRTIFKGISAVPPGMACHLSNTNDEPSWQSLQTQASELQEAPESQFWPQLCKHAKANQASLLLSGGLDSAALAAAASHAGTKVTAYHAHFSGSDASAGSDTHAARMVAQHLGLAYQEIEVNSLHALHYFGQAVRQLDQPLGDPVVLPFYLLFKAIQKQSPKQTVLTGEGGDQLFGSWSMKPMIMRELYPEAGYQREHGYLASFHKFIDEWPELLAPKLGQQLGTSSSLADPIKQAFGSSPSADFCNQLRWVDLQLKGMQHIWPRIETMARSWELSLQHPFFQPDMIELGIALPNHLKLSGTKDKVLLKMLAGHYLPNEVVERRKQGMGVPTSIWFKRGLRPLASYWLHKNRLQTSGLLNPDTVQAIRQQHIITSDGRARRWGDRLWMLCVLECWFASLGS